MNLFQVICLSYLVRESRIQQISSLGVNNSFGFSCAAWGIQHEKHVFTVHALWSAFRSCLGYLLRKKWVMMTERFWLYGANQYCIYSICKHVSRAKRQAASLLVPVTNVHGGIIGYACSPCGKVPEDTKHLASHPTALPEAKGNWPDKITSQEKKKKKSRQ